MTQIHLWAWGRTVFLPCVVERARNPADEPVKPSFLFRRIFEMPPLALAAGQHHFAMEDLVASNARDGQPVALAAKVRDFFGRETTSRDVSFRCFSKPGRRFHGRPSVVIEKNTSVSRPTYPYTAAGGAATKALFARRFLCPRALSGEEPAVRQADLRCALGRTGWQRATP
jgi:hypothetical protein